jgi:hypothetical protein
VSLGVILGVLQDFLTGAFISFMHVHSVLISHFDQTVAAMLSLHGHPA